MLRRLGIRGKILVALSVPVLVLVMLAGITVVQAVEGAQTTRATQAVLTALERARLLTTALQDERSVSLAEYGPRPMEDADLESVRENTDRAYARYRTAVSDVNFSALDQTTRAAFDALESRLGGLNSTRQFVDVGQVPTLTIDRSYTALLDGLVSFPGAVADTLGDRALAAIVSTGALVTRLIEGYQHEQALGRAALVSVQDGERDNAIINELSGFIPVHDELRIVVSSAIFTIGTPTLVPEVVASTNENPTLFPQHRRELRESAEVRLATIDPDEWVAVSERELNELRPAETEVAARANGHATAVANATIRETVLTIVFTAAAIVLALLIALAITRQITRPLRRLTVAAGVVRDELPHLVEQIAIPGQGPDLALTMIPVTSRDEVGQLATAFNEVNQTTIEVAQEQAALRASIAEMFVNVARRDQILLNRQLSFIDALERSEEDPKTLADLFRLDHLATRMRRNAESLLVLAGIDTGRRLRDPLPASDVIRTASSEIEHYERIQLDLPTDPLMLGHVALPTAHMLAEILENATVFSEPGTPVHVSTGVDDDHVLVTIEDQGLGMTPDELNEANEKIRTTSASDVLGAQRLGLFVVGRIANRLGARVEFSRAPNSNGTFVTIRMPHVLFVDPTSMERRAPSRAPETFVRPEEAAVAAHGAGPITGAQDVAPGALGSLENPAEEVKLEEFVEGTTEHGLPRRRVRGPADAGWDMAGGGGQAGQTIPFAPSPESLAGASAVESEVWSPPVVQTSTPLTTRRSAEPAPPQPAPGMAPSTQTGGIEPAFDQGAGLPTRRSGAPAEATTSGLPTRQPAARVEPPRQDTPSASGPANVEGRTAMFTGFRSRRAELAAAAIQTGGAPTETPTEQTRPSSGTDGAERLAVASFFGRHTARPQAEEAIPGDARHTADEPDAPGPVVIPALEADEEEQYGDPAFAPVAGAPAAAVPGLAPDTDDQAPAWPQAEAPAAPAPAWSQPEAPAAPAPAWSQPEAPAAPAPAWSQPEAPAAPAPAWSQPEAPAAPAPAWSQPEAPAAPAPAWSQPEAPAAPAPAWSQPEAPAARAPRAPAAPEPFAASAEMPVVDFAQLVEGPSRRSLRPAPKRRRWFHREGSESAAAEPETTATPRPAFAPTSDGAAAPEPPGTGPIPFAGGFGPIRQSAWSSGEGSHAEPAPAVQQEQPQPEWSAPAVQQEQPQPEWSAPAVQQEQPQPEWSAPAVQQEQPQPEWSAPAVQQEQPVAGAWAPQEWEPPQFPTPPQAAAPSPAQPAPAPPKRVPAAPEAQSWSPGPASGQTFTPQSEFRTFDDEMTNMLAQRADIAQQALSELSQLSSYRPQAVAGSASSLVRRTPTAVPAAPEISTKSTSQRPARDANQVRSLLSSFQSGTSRGREMATQDGNGTPEETTGADGHAGSPDGSDAGGRGQPVTTPNADTDQRGSSW